MCGVEGLLSALPDEVNLTNVLLLEEGKVVTR